MIDVIHKKCAAAGCDTLPYFGLPGGSADYRSQHKLEGMIDVIHKRCIAPECMKSPSFGVEGGSPQYCADHKPAGVIDVFFGRSPEKELLRDGVPKAHKRCMATGCTVLRSFGIPGQPAQYCNKHKLEGMINFQTKKCLVANCMTVPSFGISGDSPEYCKRHKLEGMINVKDKTCLVLGCTIYACFGFEGGKMEYCNRHKQEGMINISTKRCIILKCTIRARFGHYGEQPKYCSEHKHDGMINIRDKRCDFIDCDCRPSYGLLFSTGRTHCKRHASLNQYMDQKRNPVCNELKCLNPAIFISSDDITVYPVRCAGHKLDTDIELVKRVCPNCEESIHFPLNQQYCMNCGKYRELVICSARETAVEHILQSNNIDFIHNKRVSPNGSRHRPDFLIHSSFGYIIVEVDEKGHCLHNKHFQHDEENRMKTIYHDVQHIATGKQVLFIRYNPDKYDGPCITEDKKRLEYLLLVITSMRQLQSINIPLGYVKLFYDGFNGTSHIQPLDTDVEDD